MIQSSTNPHIIYLRTFPIQPQLECLEAAKELKTEIHRLGDFEWESENTETPTCVYPSQSYLQANRNVSGMPIFTRLLAWGEPQLTPCYFDMEVLQRYYDDPRFLFFFKDYSGRISYRERMELLLFVRRMRLFSKHSDLAMIIPIPVLSLLFKVSQRAHAGTPELLA